MKHFKDWSLALRSPAVKRSVHHLIKGFLHSMECIIINYTGDFKQLCTQYPNLKDDLPQIQ